jgi:hypothetical protein
MLRQARRSEPVRYAIVIAAAVACAFFVYVLIQLHRDEKRRSSPSSRSELSNGGPLELSSFTAVRKPGRSFAEWSRLTRKRKAVDAGAEPGRLRKRGKAAAKMAQISYVELSLPLASGVAPVVEERDSHSDALPKKIA